MNGTPQQQWVYSALVGMSLLMAGWLWQIVGTLREDVHRMQDIKADKLHLEQRSADRWTGSQQAEYRAYVDARINELAHRLESCREGLGKLNACKKM